MLNIEKTPEMLAVARRVMWSSPPAESLDEPVLFLAHVMTYGLLEDVVAVRKMLGVEAFRKCLEAAPPGIFDARSWHYWNLLYDRWPCPPMPTRDL